MIKYSDSKKKPKVKPVRPTIPASKQAELWYRQRFRQYINVIRKKHDELVSAEEHNSSFGDADINRSHTFNQLFDWLNQFDIEKFAEKVSLGVTRRANARNNKLFSKATRLVSINPEKAVKGKVQAELDSAVIRNVALIKDVHQEMLGKLSSIAKDLMFSDKSRRDIGAEFSEALQTTYQRGLFIARDQAQKINGSLIKARALEIGNDLYVEGNQS